MVKSSDLRCRLDVQQQSQTPMATTSSTIIARYACDACRVRKTRCVQSSDYLQRPSDKAYNACRRCATLGLSCTFLLPMASRGPKRRKFSLSAAQNESTPSGRGESSKTSKSADIGSSGSSGQFSQATAPVAINTELQQKLSDSEAPNDSSHRAYPTDTLCNRQVFDCIVRDYIDLVYPLIPVVHTPSFLDDLVQARDTFDSDFLGLLVAICATTMGLLPRKFYEYRSSPTPLVFQTRTQMVDQCYDMLLETRAPDYFDKISQQKWAASYLFSIAYFQLGQHNRSRMIEVEAMQLARLLEFHQISGYDGLNYIEQQLRKKAFWLMFYGYVHGQLQNMRKERLAFLDESILRTVDLANLMPAEADDELISENMVKSQPDSTLSITSGFNIHSRLFWACLFPLNRKQIQAIDVPYCSNLRATQPRLQFEHCQNRLQELKYMLDGCPVELRQWRNAEIEDDGNHDKQDKNLREAQFEAIRSNLHVTHLWLQSIIYDQIDALPMIGPNGEPTGRPTPKLLWNNREDICRQLLQVLHNVPEIYLEPNGHHLTCKVRDVAVTMLACPFPSESQVSIRAQKYLREFTDILSRLDGSERLNTLSLQSWVDTDRQRGEPTAILPGCSDLSPLGYLMDAIQG